MYVLGVAKIKKGAVGSCAPLRRLSIKAEPASSVTFVSIIQLRLYCYRLEVRVKTEVQNPQVSEGCFFVWYLAWSKSVMSRN